MFQRTIFPVTAFKLKMYSIVTNLIFKMYKRTTINKTNIYLRVIDDYFHVYLLFLMTSHTFSLGFKCLLSFSFLKNHSNVV